MKAFYNIEGASENKFDSINVECEVETNAF